MRRFSTFDLIMIALMAALGLGTKQLVRPLVSLITIPLAIPGGALAGGFYMLWLILTKRFVPKFGSGIFFGFAQALVVIIMPFGSHGIFTFFTYSLPGVGVDIVEIIFRKIKHKLLTSIIEGAIANLIGTTAVSLIIFDMPFQLLAFLLLMALFSGNLGGIIAYIIITQIKDPLINEAMLGDTLLEREEKEPQIEVASETS
ncbi:MAG TPA: ECF transporter S component [candidate division Zixibacteria bacterium]|nr:ECF transporter S component [candidate division Zixibacteria bacterium]